MPQIIQAHAKINLFLKILGPREDGFTEIVSVMQAVSLSDTITVEGAGSGLSLSSNDPNLPMDNSNTVAKAWAVMCSAVGRELGAKIDIHKRIPLESGLGGGSSDAAAAMFGIAREWDLRIDRATFEKLGSAVGSDVPFFFGSGTSLVEGRGERVADIAIPMDYALALVKPPFGMSTKEAYARAKNGLTMPLRKININHLHNSANILIIAENGNDLEKAFLELHPEAKEIENRLMRAGAGFAGLSGSGSCFFGIFDRLESAECARSQFTDLWCETALPVGLSLV